MTHCYHERTFDDKVSDKYLHFLWPELLLLAQPRRPRVKREPDENAKLGQMLLIKFL